MNRFILAPDSFKGTMTADEVCDIWEAAILQYQPQASIRRLPMADGGEGMVNAYLRVLGGERFTARVSGPLGEPVDAEYGILPNGMAVLEMASCAGLPLIGNMKDPLLATTYGVGELLRHIEETGVKTALLGLGGSATNDCGIGMAASLGYRFLDAHDSILEPLAKNMTRINRIERPSQPLTLTVNAACDVDNPLYGPHGATYTFGRQKGAEGETLELLDAGLKNAAAVMNRDLGADIATLPGAGAAGGLGAGVAAFLNGSLLPGIELLLDAAGFDDMLRETDCVFTGEGRIDWQSAHGKVPVGISRRAKAQGVPVIALCGSIGDGMEAVYSEGITAVFSAIRTIADFEAIKKSSREDMRLLADSIMRLLCMKRI